MVAQPLRYVVNQDGSRVAVVLALHGYERLLDELEELQDARAYDRAKPEGAEFVTIDEAFAEFQKGRE